MAGADGLYALTVGVCLGMLRSLRGYMAAGAAFAEGRGQALDDLAQQRLAPDMFPLSLQIHLACNQARDLVLHLQGQTPPEGPHGPEDWPSLIARIEDTIGVLEAVSSESLRPEAPVVFPAMEGQEFAFDALSFAKAWALPNFAFHAVVAFGILRAQGVPIGKIDFLSQVGPFIRPATS